MRRAASRPPTANKHKTKSMVLTPIMTWLPWVSSGVLCPGIVPKSPAEPEGPDGGKPPPAGPVALIGGNSAGGLTTVEVGDKVSVNNTVEDGMTKPGGGPDAPAGGVKPGGGPEKPAADS